MKKLIILLMGMVISQLDAQTITNFTTNDGLISDFVECIDVDVNDNIWFGTSVGAQKLNPLVFSWEAYNLAGPLSGMFSENIKEIKLTKNPQILGQEQFWIGTDFGAQVADNNPSWITYDNTNGLVGNQVKSIDEDSNGGIWIGTSQGVSYFDGNSWLSYSSPDLHWSGVNATAFDSNGDKWFASPLGGVTHFDGTTFTVYDTSNGLLSQNVTSLLIDNQDNKWIGTSLGMSVLNSSNTYFTHHIEMYSLPPPHDSINPVVDIEMDSYGRIWTAIYVGYLGEGGIAYWNGSQWEDFHVSDGLAGPNVRDLVIDSQDNVWVATSTGVSKISSPPNSVSNVSKSINEVYPNPTSGKIYINTPSSKFNTVSVYNNLGSLIYFENLKYQHKIEIDFSSFKKGVYHLSLQFNEGVKNHKILIQ